MNYNYDDAVIDQASAHLFGVDYGLSQSNNHYFGIGLPIHH